MMIYNIVMITVRCSPLPNRNPGIVSVNSEPAVLLTEEMHVSPSG
jgi:hypothetical protein